jgi:predicted metal-dependent phosphoesterase TrpH
VRPLWSKADIHIHTTYSADGTAGVEQVLEYVATKTDLRVVAITDHDEIAGALKARRLASQYGLDVIVGEEVSTAEGHLLALFIEQWLPPGRPAAETIAAVHAQGGLCIAAHPFAWLVPSLGWNGLRERTGPGKDWLLDGVESYNASLWLHQSNMTAERVGKGLNLAICGGSDSHQLSTIGLGYTLFPGATAQDLRRAIATRQTRATCTQWGPVRTAEYLGLKFHSIARHLTNRAPKPSTP